MFDVFIRFVAARSRTGTDKRDLTRCEASGIVKVHLEVRVCACVCECVYPTANFTDPAPCRGHRQAHATTTTTTTTASASTTSDCSPLPFGAIAALPSSWMPQRSFVGFSCKVQTKGFRKMNFAPAPKRSQVRATTGHLLTTCAFGPGLKRLLSALSLTIGVSLCRLVCCCCCCCCNASLARSHARCMSLPLSVSRCRRCSF